MLKSLAMTYLSSVLSLVDNITEEQMEQVIAKAKEIVDLVENGEHVEP